MEHKIYEPHYLEDEKLPVYFHYDIVGNKTETVYQWHTNIEILYVVKGEGEVMLGSETSRMEAGDIVVINSNVLHSFASDTRVEYYCLIIDDEFLKANDISAEKTELKSIIHSSEAAQIFEAIISEMYSKKAYAITAVKIEILRLMLYLSRNFPADEETKNGFMNADESIQLAVGYIRSHLNENMPLERIAGEVGLSKYYFLRKFKNATGMTPVAFINMLRCRDAKKLLKKQKYSIHEIAVKCGFDNDSYFSRTFKKYTGMLPSEYQNKAI